MDPIQDLWNPGRRGAFAGGDWQQDNQNHGHSSHSQGWQQADPWLPGNQSHSPSLLSPPCSSNTLGPVCAEPQVERLQGMDHSSGFAVSSTTVTPCGHVLASWAPHEMLVQPAHAQAAFQGSSFGYGSSGTFTLDEAVAGTQGLVGACRAMRSPLLEAGNQSGGRQTLELSACLESPRSGGCSAGGYNNGGDYAQSCVDTPCSAENKRELTIGSIGHHPYCSCFCKFLVPDACAGLIIGKSGGTISEIQDSSGCRLYISGPNSFFPGTHDRVCIAGASNLERLTSAVMQVVGLLGDGQKWTFKFVIPKSAASRIIGPKGVKLQNLTAKTGCTINMSPRMQDFQERLLLISKGRLQAEAIAGILETLQEDSHLQEYMTVTYAQERPFGFWTDQRDDSADPECPLMSPEEARSKNRRQLVTYLTQAAPRHILYRLQLLGSIKCAKKNNPLATLVAAVEEIWILRGGPDRPHVPCEPGPVQRDLDILGDQGGEVDQGSELQPERQEPMAIMAQPEEPPGSAALEHREEYIETDDRLMESFHVAIDMIADCFLGHHTAPPEYGAKVSEEFLVPSISRIGGPLGLKDLRKSHLPTTDDELQFATVDLHNGVQPCSAQPSEAETAVPKMKHKSFLCGPDEEEKVEDAAAQSEEPTLLPATLDTAVRLGQAIRPVEPKVKRMPLASGVFANWCVIPRRASRLTNAISWAMPEPELAVKKA